MNNETKKTLKKIMPLSLCCLIPILLLAAIPLIRTYSTLGASVISLIAPFICPLLMITAFLLLAKGEKSCCSNKDN